MIFLDMKGKFFMIHSRNLHDESKPYLTELTNGREGVEPVISDSSAKGGANMSPSELLQAALAGCTNMTARELLDERGIPFDDIFVDVKMERIDGRTVITRSVKIISSAPDDVIREVIKEAERCYVGRILTGEIEVNDE